MRASVNEKIVVAQREVRPTTSVHRRVARESTSQPRGLAFRSILIPIDFSETSNAALRYAVALAQDYGADISLIHVVEPEAYNLLSEIKLSESKITFVEWATSRLAKLAKEVIPSSINVNPWVQVGAPYDEIATAAKFLNADLIVISTHGYTGFHHAILGSTAERVVRHAHCPVLVIRNPEGSQ